jgi:integrase
MASLYLRRESPFFWISYLDGNGLRRQESTRLRHADRLDIRKARALEAQRTAEEMARNAGKRSGRGSGWSWVPGWLALRYQHSAGTFRALSNRWKPLSLFLAERKISGPEALRRQHCFDYIAWRTTDKPPVGCFRAGHNSALAEIHALSIVMEEARNRQLVDGNPCIHLGIRKKDSKRKGELTANDIKAIRQEIPQVRRQIVREMLHVSFEIARHQGCRLAETRLHLRDNVNLERRTITFATKTRKVHTTTLHPALVPLLRKLIRDGKVYSWEAPEGYAPATWAAKEWYLVFRRLNLGPGKCFHSTRLTVATEMARAGVPRTKAMEFLAHSTSLIHSVYTRLQPDDLGECVAAIAAGKKRSA